MDKITLAYKMTSDIFKNYSLEKLESKYNLFGGSLITAVFNEIYKEICVTNETNETDYSITFVDDLSSDVDSSK